MNTAIKEKLIDSTVKADLARTFEGRLVWRLAILDMAVNVLDHDDGVADDESDRDGKCHQRQVVETEIKQVHHRERAEERQRHRDARNERRPEIPQENQYDQHHQHDGQHQGELDVLHRSADRLGAVLHDRDIDGGRNVLGQPRQLRLDLVDGLDDVGAWLLEDDQHNATLAVLEGSQGAVGRAADRLAYVANPDRAAVAVGDNGFVERLWIDDLVVGGNREARPRRIDGALCCNRGCTDERFTHLLQRQVAGGELGRVDLDADRRMLLTVDRHLGDAGHLGDLLGHEIIGIVVDGRERQGVGLGSENQDRGIGGIDLLVARRRRHVARQCLFGHCDRRLNVLGCRINVAAELELYRYRSGVQRAHRSQLGDPGDLPELALQRCGDRGGHGLRAGALQRRVHLNGGKIDLRQGRDREERNGHKSDEADRCHQQRSRYRPLDERFGNIHNARPR